MPANMPANLPANLSQSVVGLRSGLTCYLFIYVVRQRDGSRDYCTVMAYGRSLEAAERIAINRVHQHDLHIERADTATAAPWLDPARDADYLSELNRYGTALRLAGLAASAA